ncbi:MAG: ABC transporter substrate-binding protein [Burkholderiales bacterium]
MIAMMLMAGFTHAATAADPAKVLRIPFEAPDSGFDGALTTNLYSGKVLEAIFEPLLTYDYMARPARTVPGTAEAMPEVSNGGKTFIFHLRKGIYFTPDPAFNGKRRELIANDYAYTFKRALDPRNRSPIRNFLAGKIVGLDGLASQASRTGHFDYDAPVAGLQTPDRYTLRIELNAPDYNFLYVMAFTGLGAVAREVIEAYAPRTGEHPVGTGAYMLRQYVPGSKIVLVANPDYRGFVWDFKASGEPGDAAIVNAMHGKTMPQIGRVEISIIQEEQSRWLAFEDKQLDLDFLPQLAAPNVIRGDQLKPEYAQKGIRLNRAIEPVVTFTIFNMTDPIVGGYSNEKIALRRAIAMAYNIQAEVDLIRNGQAMQSEMLIPPGVTGFDPLYRSSIAYDPVLANQLLDHFGYKRGPDGYRTMPDGKPLLLQIHREADVANTEMAELWKRSLEQIGIRAEHPVSNFSDNQKAASECKLMIWGSAWYADYPDGENFLQLLYGPNAHQGNIACYQSAAFDSLYRKAMALPPGAERTRLYAEMNRQMEADTPWVVQSNRVRNWISQPWVTGFKKHPILNAEWKYLDVATH